MPDTPPEIDVPPEFISLKYPLPHLAEALRGKGPVRIVAMGSSSTAGREDVVPYPHRLEMYLRVPYKDRFPELRIDVLNRGRGGEEAIEELPRFDTDIFAERPSLVIWQVLDDKAELSARMVSLISSEAEKAGVSAFRRWALMRHWHVHDNVSFERMLDPTDQDKLHQSDWSTLRISRALCDAITKALPPIV
jgi:hypothetical protein